jgi:hypothetical protein
MREISSEPGQALSKGAGTSFETVPVVAISKRTLNRQARFGLPERQGSGEATELSRIVDGAAAFASWWKSQTPSNSLKRAYLRARGRRAVVFWPRLEVGSALTRVAKPGRSSPQVMRWWSSITPSGSSFIVSAELAYSDIREVRPLPEEVIELTGIGITSITPGVTVAFVSLVENILTFSVTPGAHRSILLRISGTEARGYDGFLEADLRGAPAQLKEVVELLLPTS